MPYAVTHVLLSIILVDIYRDYFAKDKKFFTMHTLFLAGVGGLLPDVDIALRMLADLFNIQLWHIFSHGIITHTPFFALLFFIPGLILWKKKKPKVAMYMFVLAFGIMLHLILDYVIGGGAMEGVMWLFPFSTQAWKIHIVFYLGMPDLVKAMDAVFLLAWLWHEEVKHKISDFI